MLSAAIETARNNVKETPMHNTASRKKTLLKDLSKLKAEKGDAYKDCTEYWTCFLEYRKLSDRNKTVSILEDLLSKAIEGSLMKKAGLFFQPLLMRLIKYCSFEESKAFFKNYFGRLDKIERKEEREKLVSLTLYYLQTYRQGDNLAAILKNIKKSSHYYEYVGSALQRLVGKKDDTPNARGLITHCLKYDSAEELQREISSTAIKEMLKEKLIPLIGEVATEISYKTAAEVVVIQDDATMELPGTPPNTPEADKVRSPDRLRLEVEEATKRQVVIDFYEEQKKTYGEEKAVEIMLEFKKFPFAPTTEVASK
jgi:hypothetical protein